MDYVKNNLNFLKKNKYIAFFFLIFFFVPNFLDFKINYGLIQIKLKFFLLFVFNIYFAQKFLTNEKIEFFEKKIISYLYLFLFFVYLSSILYYYFVVDNSNFNKSYYFHEKIILSFFYLFSLLNLIIYICLNLQQNIFSVFNKILFYFTSIIILEFLLIKILFFLNYNNLIFNINFYEIFLVYNPIVYYDQFYNFGRIFRSAFFGDHLITSFILFLGFISNFYYYETKKKKIFIFFGFACLILSFYNLESRLTILNNLIMLTIIMLWRYISLFKINYILLTLIVGFYLFIFFIKIGCSSIYIDSGFFNTICKLDSLYDRFSLALFSFNTWLNNPITFGHDMLNNFYTLNQSDFLLNNSFTSGDSYVSVTTLRNGKYAFWHGGEITYPHNFFISMLGAIGIIFPILFYIFIKKINFNVSNVEQKYMSLMLIFSLINSLINKIFFIEIYIFLFATLLFFSKKDVKI